MSNTVKAVEWITAERNRQISTLGYSAEQDKKYTDGQLAFAAKCYETPQTERSYIDNMIPIDWPFNKKYWKPTPGDRVRELVKAGALYMAENERLGEATYQKNIEDIATKIADLLPGE